MVNNLPDKLPPQNTEAEQCLLGCLMLDKDAIVKVVDFIKAEDFYKGGHQDIYQTMAELYEKSDPIDILSVSARLKERNKLENIGGSAYLTSLINTVPTATHVSNYAKIVRQKKILRDLISASEEIGLSAFNEAEEVDVLLDKAEKTVFGIGQRSLTQQFLPIKDILADTFERLDELSKYAGKMRGVPTGFTDLDKILGGLQKSDLVILAARPSMGKTSLALDIARNAAIRHKHHVAIFSLEMSVHQLVDRVISAESYVDSWKLRTGKVNSEEELARIRDAMAALSSAPIYIDDESSNNIVKMKAEARRLKGEFGLDLIIVDYLQLMVPRTSSESMVQQVTEISRSLKQLARELEVPVIALSQLSRAVEQRGGKPRLSDLRDSGSIEQDADVVMFIHREDKQNELSDQKNIAEIMIEKHRNGPTGSIKLYFDEARTSFVSIDKNQQGGDFGTF